MASHRTVHQTGSRHHRRGRRQHAQESGTPQIPTLAASRYTVYLHPSEFRRLEGIVPILREQTARALREELEKLNQGSRVRRWLGRSARRPGADVQNAGSDWHVEFVADPDGDLADGDSARRLRAHAAVESRPPEWVNAHAVSRPSTPGREQRRGSTRTSARQPRRSASVRATIVYEDDSRPSFLRRRQGIVDGRAWRHRVSGGRTNRVLPGRLLASTLGFAATPRPAASFSST